MSCDLGLSNGTYNKITAFIWAKKTNEYFTLMNTQILFDFYNYIS